MYLDLSIPDNCFKFEYVHDVHTYYFNIDDYQFYSPEERQESINSEAYEASSFLLISQIDRNEIIDKYLIGLNNVPLMRKIKGTKDPEHSFYMFIWGNNLDNEWNRFEKKELIRFASEWCKENGIRFSAKDHPSWERYY